MEFSSEYQGKTAEIASFFGATFAAFEGKDEGELIGGLVTDLLSTTPADDLFVFTALDEGALVGGCVFSRLTYEEDGRFVVILSPVAVDPARQGQGIGQALLNHGLGELKKHGIDVVMTYGDPNYYAKVGFEQITEDVAQAPLALQYPEGWLAQSLKAGELTPLIGPSRCVAALNQPHFW